MTDKKSLRMLRDATVQIKRNFFHGMTRDTEVSFHATIVDAYRQLRETIRSNGRTLVVEEAEPTSFRLAFTLEDEQQVTIDTAKGEIRAQRAEFVYTASEPEILEPLIELLCWHYYCASGGLIALSNAMSFSQRTQKPSPLPQFVIESYFKKCNFLDSYILKMYGLEERDIEQLRRYASAKDCSVINAVNDLWMIDPDGANKTFADVLREHGILPPLENAA